MWRLKKGFNAVEYDNITMIKHIENDYSTKNRELIPDVLIAATKAYNYSWKMRGQEWVTASIASMIQWLTDLKGQHQLKVMQ